MLTRFQSSSALAIRSNTGWTRPSVGGRARGAFMGIKTRAKRFLARPGIQNAMSRVGRGLGTGVALVKGAAGVVRRKAGFSSLQNLAEFRRRGLAGHGSAHLIGFIPRCYSSSRLVEFRRRRGFRFRRRKPTFAGHTSKGAAYGALTGGALGASLGGAGSYAAARNEVGSRKSEVGTRALARRIREDRRRR